MFKELIISMRPQQWYKNFLIFVALVFSQNLLNLHMLKLSILGFIAFCMASSSQYLLNDIIDKEKDQKHPKKSKRPIASGKLPINIATFSALLLLILALLLSYSINIIFLCAVIFYLTLNFIYSIFLKEIVLMDVLTISIGFVIRAVAGAFAIGVAISPWLILCTFLLALFLALGKRRHEMIILGNVAKEHRNVLKLYSKDAIEHMLSITTSMTIISYSLYTFSESLEMMITIPVVIYAMFRYLLRVYTENFGGETELIFKDREILVSIVIWVMLVICILYLR